MGVVETVVGVILGLLAGLMFTIGAVLQKKAVDNLPTIKMSDIDSMKPMLKDKTWLLGIGVGLLGGIPYMVSQLLIGIGYTQLLIAGGLILLAYMASRTLGEPLGIVEYTGIALIVGGMFFLGLADLSPVASGLLADPNFIINTIIFYIPFYAVSAAGLLFYKFSEKGAAKILGAISGVVFGCGAGFSQIGILGLEAGAWLLLIIGYMILILGTVIGTLVANVAFQKGKAIVVIPLQSAGNYLIPVVAGLLLFGQMVTSVEFFIASIILIMAGVMLLSRIQAEMEKPTEETATE